MNRNRQQDHLQQESTATASVDRKLSPANLSLATAGHQQQHQFLSINSISNRLPDVSPQILRRIQWQMKNRHNKDAVYEHHHRLEHHPSASDGRLGPQIIHSNSAPAAPTTSGSGSGSRLGFMEARIPRFQKIRLRTTRQLSSVEQGVWRPTENQSWRSTGGAELKLRGKRLETLASVERQALQKYAFNKLQKINLGCTINKPKDVVQSGQKRHRYTRHKAHTVSIVEKKKDPNSKSLSPVAFGQQVFGVPLSQCVEYEQQKEIATPIAPARGSPPPCGPDVVATKTNGHSSAQQQHQPYGKPGLAETKQQQSQQESRCQSLDLEEMDFLHVARMSPQRLSAESSKSSLSDQASTDSLTLVMKPTCSKGSLDAQTSTDIYPATDRRYASSDNLTDPTSAITPNRHSATALSKQDSCEPHCPRVPKIVQSCTNYLKGHGLQTIGLFRIAGSAKRCRQLRVELDSGQEIVLADDQSDVYPHDVATLLKEYFRDLPDPLLTKELYPAFVNCTKQSDDNYLETLRFLIYLLPVVNCDTLLILLQFLRQVAVHSYDTINDQGVSVSGNKMNSHNLATIFGPTILRPGGSKRQSQQLTDNEAVIKVVESLIDHCDDLFSITKETLDLMYKLLQETDPDSLDTILTRLHTGSHDSHGDEQEEHTMTTVYLSSQEELDPVAVSRDADGTTVIKTRQQTTHRIIYKVHKHTGRILECMRDNSGSSGGTSGSQSSCDFTDNNRYTFSPAAAMIGDKFPELSLFSDDAPELNDSPAELIDPSLIKPRRKTTPLSRFAEAIMPASPKH